MNRCWTLFTENAQVSCYSKRRNLLIAVEKPSVLCKSLWRNLEKPSVLLCKSLWKGDPFNQPWETLPSSVQRLMVTKAVSYEEWWIRWRKELSSVVLNVFVKELEKGSTIMSAGAERVTDRSRICSLEGAVRCICLLEVALSNSVCICCENWDRCHWDCCQPPANEIASRSTLKLIDLFLC